jgi:hypothetical protein
MISTADKRSMVLRVGMTHLAGTRFPNGSIDRYDRASLLGGYTPTATISTSILVLSFTLSLNRALEMELIR